jgi:diacylglycerol kinase family enzyme
MAGIGVVVNPKSRHNLRHPGALPRLARSVGSLGTVREARTIDELHRIAEDFRRDKIDVLAISGGDGTNTVTLSGFVHVYGGAPLPDLALLRGGTMNTVANSVGVRHGSPEHLLTSLVRAYAAKADGLRRAERRLLCVSDVSARGGPARALPQYGFLFGTGVMVGFLAEYYATGNPSPLVAAGTLARASASALVAGPMIRRMAAPFRGTVALADGTVWEERDYLAVAAGTIAHIGLAFKPFYRFGEGHERGAFHALGIHASPLAFVAELGRVHAGHPMRPGKAHEALSARMLIRSASGTVNYMVDGDLHAAAGEIEVTIGPRVRLLIAP